MWTHLERRRLNKISPFVCFQVSISRLGRPYGKCTHKTDRDYTRNAYAEIHGVGYRYKDTTLYWIQFPWFGITNSLSTQNPGTVSWESIMLNQVLNQVVNSDVKKWLCRSSSLLALFQKYPYVKTTNDINWTIDLNISYKQSVGMLQNMLPTESDQTLWLCLCRHASRRPRLSPNAQHLQCPHWPTK